MKTRLIFICLSLFFFSIEAVDAQSGLIGRSVVPLKPQSPLFGKDIVIHDSISQNQSQVIVRSAFNGWLYAEYSATDPTYNTPTTTILKSVDNGISWTLVMNLVWPGPYESFKSTDMLVIGDSISKLKLILATVGSGLNNPELGRGDAYVWRYNANTGDFEDGLMMDAGVSGIALATDYMYPATNSNPFSFGVVYSKYSPTSDSIIIRTSSNGGTSLNSKQSLPSSAGRIFKVSLAYGRSPSWSTGRYFAAWEEKSGIGTTLGHIYTAHTDPDFSSPLTSPVNLDGLDSTDKNMCRHPSISCQYSNLDNDNSNLTEVVLFDKYDPSNLKFDVTGYYNLQAANNTNFNKLNISNSAHYNCQTSINFNPYDSTFMISFYDSTTQKLPFLLNNCNLANPNTWQWVTSGYNDDSNLSAPYPKVTLDLGQQQGVNVWAKEGTNGKGIAMFDASYSTWTGISGNVNTDDSQSLQVYPNPCSSILKIAFKLKNTAQVSIILYGSDGRVVGIIANNRYPNGLNVINYDVSQFSPGGYMLCFRNGDFVKTFKTLIVR